MFVGVCCENWYNKYCKKPTWCLEVIHLDLHENGSNQCRNLGIEGNRLIPSHWCRDQLHRLLSILACILRHFGTNIQHIWVTRRLKFGDFYNKIAWNLLDLCIKTSMTPWTELPAITKQLAWLKYIIEPFKIEAFLEFRAVIWSKSTNLLDISPENGRIEAKIQWGTLDNSVNRWSRGNNFQANGELLSCQNFFFLLNSWLFKWLPVENRQIRLYINILSWLETSNSQKN